MSVKTTLGSTRVKEILMVNTGVLIDRLEDATPIVPLSPATFPPDVIILTSTVSKKGETLFRIFHLLCR